MKKALILIPIYFLFWGFQMQAQDDQKELIINEDSLVCEVDEALCLDLKAVIIEKVSQYIQLGTFVDSTDKVDETITRKFASLFYSNTNQKIFNDLSTNCKNRVTVSSYIGQVLFTGEMYKYGVKYDIDSIELVKIRERDSLSYAAEVRVHKTMFNGLGENGNYIDSLRRLCMPIHLTYYIPKDNYANTKIDILDGVCQCEEEYELQEGFSLTIGGRIGSFLNANQAQEIPFENEFSVSPHASIALSYFQEIKKEKNKPLVLFWYAGIGLNTNTMRWSLEATELYKYQRPPGNEPPYLSQNDLPRTDYQRSITVEEALVENFNTNLGLNFGFGYKMIKRDKISYSLGLSMHPAFFIGSSKFKEGQITYDTRYDDLSIRLAYQSEIRANRMEADDAAIRVINQEFGIGTFDQEDLYGQSYRGFSFGIQAQPSIDIRISDKLEFTLGLPVRFTSASINDQGPEALVADNLHASVANPKGSVGSFYNSFSYLTYGLNLGLKFIK